MSAGAGEVEVSEPFDPDTGELIERNVPDDVRLAWQPMNEDQARKVTSDINVYAKRLCMLVKDAKDGRAWEALGYGSWSEYVDAELNVSRSRAYQLLDQAEIAALAAVLAVLPVSTVVDTLPEGRTRGIGTDQLREALTAAVMDLTPNPTTAQRLAVVESTIETLRGEVREAKKRAAAPKNPAPDAGAPASLAPVSDPTSAVVGPAATDAPNGQQEVPAPPAARPSPGNDPAPAVDPATGKPDEPHAVEAPGSAEGASGGEPTSTAPPALPDDWRARLACSVHLLGCPADALRAVLTDDDRIDLTDLHTYLTDLLELNA